MARLSREGNADVTTWAGLVALSRFDAHETR
jgi:hypothetical protein